GAFFVFPLGAEAAVLEDRESFFVDSGYDAHGRTQLMATVKAIGDNIYFYIEDDYWNNLSGTDKNRLREELEELVSEFDTVIYPKERAVFGSEWTPGIDGDKRITVLVSELINNAGGYFNTNDEFLQSQIPSSNQREMFYVNTAGILNSKNKAILAHEFQHLISFYQKTVLYNLEEEVWLNEARSEYAPTVCGYSDNYVNSYLAERVDSFLDEPSDPLGEWKNNIADYGVAGLFMHYLAGHYGENVVTRMILNNKTGIDSINAALSDLGYSETFSDVFAGWTVANYLNDCDISMDNKYCYLNKNLTHQRLNVDYSASYSGFPNLIVSRSSSLKDWSPRWYRLNQGTVQETDRDTLKLEFDGAELRGDFSVPYIVTGPNSETTVQFIPLDNQKGSVYIPNFSSLNKSVVIIPFNQYKRKGFSSNELSTSFSFTASSVAFIPPIIESTLPDSGFPAGGTEITVSGENLSLVEKITLGGKTVSDFEIVDNQTISFISPAHSAGSADLILFDSDNNQTALADAFNYLPSYADGSLIRAKGDYKVYIIKGSYKRWIQSAEIFNYYGHLNWESIVEVSKEELSNYKESWLIRADGDKRVYEVNADGTKHWLDMTAEEFSITGRLWDMVYIINTSERNLYRTGSNVMYAGD
ncbi:MAG: IPT/TIG domain-containing protein, partial [Patescibacteria group bacterium]|nr:IPT/TIG domain-containing protein [Patescibacteria group bacterium]